MRVIFRVVEKRDIFGPEARKIQEFEKYEQAEKCIIGMIEDSEELGIHVEYTIIKAFQSEVK